MIFQEDNNGFIMFPYGNLFSITENEKTLIYLVAFEPRKPGIISNVNITLPGDFVADDVIDRVHIKDDVIENLSCQSQYDNIYFPNDEDDVKRMTSMSLVSCICVGWSESSYEFRDGTPWKATYRDLTHEGKKLYYSMKKLHNNKEIRILTFNNI